MIEDGTATQRSRAQPAEVEGSWLRSLLVFLFRLLLLGVGSTLAWLVGLLIAQFYSAPPTTSPPLQESLGRRSSRTVTKLQQLPQWWQQGNTAPQVIVPNSIPASGSAGEPASAAVPKPDLTPAEQQAIETDLAAIESDLAALSDRATKLESQVGQQRPPRTLEDRIAAIASAIAPAPDTAVAETADPSLSLPLTPLPTASQPAVDLPKITLPGQVLFAEDSAQLRPEAEALLAALVPDLSTYPSATILIAAHTAPQPTADASRQLSFCRLWLSAALWPRS
ncbi:MAG: hypothetical protein HC886_02350 [Leptolyngbyaceae cyanobacterium SM1_1_3]|nr:hypothetical protein [Leptolyngbyaceae cyanobacterium SM1_1_3]